MSELNDDLNDEVLAEKLFSAMKEMLEGESIFEWFENRGISREAAKDLANIIAEETTIVQSGALTGFVAGWSLCEGLMRKEHA